MPAPEVPEPRPNGPSGEAAGFRPPLHRGRFTYAAALALARVAPGRLWGAFAVPLLPMVVLGSVLFARLVPQRFAWTDGPVVLTAGPAAAPLAGTELVELAVFALLLPLSLGIGLTAALVVAAASCLHVPVSVRSALRAALAQPRTVGVAALSALLFLASPAVAFQAAEVAVLLGVAAALFPLGGALLLAHRAARMVVALPRDTVTPAPRWAWWPIPAGRMLAYTSRPAALLLTALVLGTLVGWGTSLLPGPPPFRWTAALLLVGAVCVTGGSWLATLLVTGAMEYQDDQGPAVPRDRRQEEREARQRARVETARADLTAKLDASPHVDPYGTPPEPQGGDRSASGSSGREAALVTVAAVAAVLVLPVALWVRPVEPVALSVEYIPLNKGPGNGQTALGLTAFDNGLRLSTGSDELWCDPDCTVASHRDNGVEPARVSHSSTPGGTVRAKWQREHLPPGSTADAIRSLTLGSDCDARGCHAPEQELDVLEVFGHLGVGAESLAVVTEHDAGFHVVTAASGNGREVTVDVRSCADECSEPVTLGLVPAWGSPRLLPERLLDSATGPNGAPAVTLYDSPTGAVRLFRCSDTACTDTSDKEIVAPAVVGNANHQPADWGDVLTGASVEVRPDGRPVVAYRAADGSARLVDCADADCTRSEERVITGPGWEQHLPGMALDPEGRPVLALADSDADTLSLVICADSGCAEWESRVLHDAVRVNSGAVVVVDPGGRPVVAAVLAPVEVRIGERAPAEVVALHRCAEPGCGLES